MVTRTLTSGFVSSNEPIIDSIKIMKSNWPKVVKGHYLPSSFLKSNEPIVDSIVLMKSNWPKVVKNFVNVSKFISIIEPYSPVKNSSATQQMYWS